MSFICPGNQFPDGKNRNVLYQDHPGPSFPLLLESFNTRNNPLEKSFESVRPFRWAFLLFFPVPYSSIPKEVPTEPGANYIGSPRKRKMGLFFFFLLLISLFLWKRSRLSSVFEEPVKNGGVIRASIRERFLQFFFPSGELHINTWPSRNKGK